MEVNKSDSYFSNALESCLGAWIPIATKGSEVSTLTIVSPRFRSPASNIQQLLAKTYRWLSDYKTRRCQLYKKKHHYVYYHAKNTL